MGEGDEEEDDENDDEVTTTRRRKTTSAARERNAMPCSRIIAWRKVAHKAAL